MQFFCQNFQQHREQNRFVYAFGTPEAGAAVEADSGAEAADEGFDFSNMELADLPELNINFEDLISNEAATTKAEQMPPPVEGAGESIIDRAWGKVTDLFGGEETPEEKEAREVEERFEKEVEKGKEKFEQQIEAFESEDVHVAAKVYKEASNMPRKLALAIYNISNSTPAGSEGQAALWKLGIEPKNYKEVKRAMEGKVTLSNAHAFTAGEKLAQDFVEAVDIIDEGVVEPALDTAAEAMYHGVMKPANIVSAHLDEQVINPLSEKIDQGFQTNEFFKARKNIKKGNMLLASKIFQEVKGMSRKQVKKKYGSYRMYSTGKDMAYAVLRDMGVSVKDRDRASKGAPTIDNIPIDISPQEVAQLKDSLIPKDTLVNEYFARIRGKKIDQLTDEELAGTSVLNAFEGVAGGIVDFAKWGISSVKDFFVKGEKKVKKEFDLVKLGEKGDLIIRIINEKFTNTQKFAIFAQFLAEGAIGGALTTKAVSLIGKIGKIKGIGKLFNKIDGAQTVLARGIATTVRGTAKAMGRAAKVGTGRLAGRGTAIEEDFEASEAVVRRETEDDGKRKA